MHVYLDFSHMLYMYTSIGFLYIQSDATSNVAIKNLMLKRGHQLEELYLDRNISLGTPSLRAIQVQ